MATDLDLDRLEHRIGQLMRAGVAVSAVVLIGGLALVGLGAPSGIRILNLGLILLMLIPASRILVSFVDAVFRRDRLLIVSTAVVSSVILWQVLNKIL